MGFPLSTDIFGQLKWLVKQVKLLVFRVTRLEQGGGGGGSQTIDQVLATGSTATNKSLLMNDTLGVFPSSIGIGSTFGNSGGEISGIKLQGPNGNFYDILNINSSTIKIDNTDSGDVSYVQSGAFSLGNANSPGVGASLTYLGTYITNGDYYNQSVANYSRIVRADDSFSIYLDASQAHIRMYDSVTTGTLLTTTIKANFISVDDNATGQSAKLNLLPNSSSIFTSIDGIDVGINLNYNTRKYTIGEERAGNEYFGIDISNARLMGGGIHQGGAHIAPTGYVEIFIDGTQYWIELWT